MHMLRRISELRDSDLNPRARERRNRSATSTGFSLPDHQIPVTTQRIEDLKDTDTVDVLLPSSDGTATMTEEEVEREEEERAIKRPQRTTSLPKASSRKDTVIGDLPQLQNSYETPLPEHYDSKRQRAGTSMLFARKFFRNRTATLLDTTSPRARKPAITTTTVAGRTSKMVESSEEASPGPAMSGLSVGESEATIANQSHTLEATGKPDVGGHASKASTTTLSSPPEPPAIATASTQESIERQPRPLSPPQPVPGGPAVIADDPKWQESKALVTWLHSQDHWMDSLSTGRVHAASGSPVDIPKPHFSHDPMTNRVTITVSNPVRPPSPSPFTQSAKLFLHVQDLWNKGIPFNTSMSLQLYVNGFPRGPSERPISGRNEKRGYNASVKFGEAYLLDVYEHSTVELSIWAKVPPVQAPVKKRRFGRSPTTQNHASMLWSAGGAPGGYYGPPSSSISKSFSISRMLSRSTTASTLHVEPAGPGGAAGPSTNVLHQPTTTDTSSLTAPSIALSSSPSIASLADIPSEPILLAKVMFEVPPDLFSNEGYTFRINLENTDIWARLAPRPSSSKERKALARHPAGAKSLVSAEMTVKIGVFEEFQAERLQKILAPEEPIFAEHLTLCIHNDSSRIRETWKRYWVTLERGGSCLTAYDFEYKTRKPPLFILDLIFLPATDISTATSSDYFPVPNGFELSLHYSAAETEEQLLWFRNGRTRLWDEKAIMRAYADDTQTLHKWVRLLKENVTSLRKFS